LKSEIQTSIDNIFDGPYRSGMCELKYSLDSKYLDACYRFLDSRLDQPLFVCAFLKRVPQFLLSKGQDAYHSHILSRAIILHNGKDVKNDSLDVILKLDDSNLKYANTFIPLYVAVNYRKRVAALRILRDPAFSLRSLKLPKAVVNGIVDSWHTGEVYMEDNLTYKLVRLRIAIFYLVVHGKRNPKEIPIDCIRGLLFLL
jgi:hypothetical protein